MTVNELLAMTDHELGCHASGGYGAKKRNEFYASLRAALLAAAQKQPVKQPEAAS